MLSKNLEKAINSQINFELYSSYIYLSMSAYFYSENLKGFANWMGIQAQEELTHAMKFFDYVNNRGGRVIVEAIKKPETAWASPLEVFEHTYKHETIVTSRINNIADIALKEKDHATHAMLQWFITEQVEEEANAQELIQELKRVKSSPDSLFMLDRELAQRTFVPAPGVTLFGMGAAAGGAA